MRKKISVSIKEETINKLDEYIEDGAFRSKSHVVEFALNKFIEDKKNG